MAAKQAKVEEKQGNMAETNQKWQKPDKKLQKKLQNEKFYR